MSACGSVTTARFVIESARSSIKQSVLYRWFVGTEYAAESAWVTQKSPGATASRRDCVPVSTFVIWVYAPVSSAVCHETHGHSRYGSRACVASVRAAPVLRFVSRTTLFRDGSRGRNCPASSLQTTRPWLTEG